MLTTVRGGGVYVHFKPGSTFDLKRAFQLINAGGFQARKPETVFTLSGTVALEGEQLVLTVDQTKAPLKFELLEPKEVPKFLEKEIAVSGPGETMKLLRQRAEANSKLVVELEAMAVVTEDAPPRSLQVLRIVTKS